MKGMPREWVLSMFEDYRRLHSLSACAKLHGRTRQAIHRLFKTHGLPRYPKRVLPFKMHRGIKYTPSKGGYLRANLAGRRPLHHVIWMERHGPIPPGHQVFFNDKDKMNFALKNLDCRPVAEVSSIHATGVNQFTHSAPARLGLLVKNFKTGKTSLAASIK